MSARTRSVLMFIAVAAAWVGAGSAWAVTGSGVSATGALETVRPKLTGIGVTGPQSLEATFSESLLPAEANLSANYSVSGIGAGTLGSHPATAVNGTPVLLTWGNGEGQDGAPLVLSVTNLRDLLGNPIDPAFAEAQGAAVGIAPTFSNLVVTPSTASDGETVLISFTSSEPLNGDPEVLVNGNPATRTAKATFNFEYTVSESDPEGPATITVNGFDLAGNVGSLSEQSALTVNNDIEEVPVHAWPLIVSIGLAGTLLLRRRRAAGLLALLLLAPAIAHAATPTITNVTFTQQPSANGTEVVITYDIVSPNAPSYISVHLSKDGGTDGYIHPVTAITGDLFGVTTGTGKTIVWNLAGDYPEEAIPNARLRVTADDIIPEYTIQYLAGIGGSITGTATQTALAGSNTTEVVATPDSGFAFIQWSDGVTSPNRIDLFTADRSLTAQFTPQYTLDYTAGSGGSLSGVASQLVLEGNDGTAITAVPNVGYHFVQWSDGATGNPRIDTNVTANISVTAQFAVDTFTLSYTAGPNGSISGTSPQTVDYATSGSPVTAVADVNYHFEQWSDGSTDNPRTDINVTSNISVTAQFSIDTYTLSYAAGPNGSLSGNTAQVVGHGSNGTPVTAIPDSGYVFQSWSDGVLTAARTDSNVTANLAVTANFVQQFTLTYTAGPNGTISGTSPQNVIIGTDGSAVTAIPDSGYVFQSWSDGVLTATRTETNVTANKSVTAFFAQQFTLTYTSSVSSTTAVGGTITGSTPQTVISGGSGTAVTAVAKPGSAFSQWSDGVLTATRTDTNVLADISVTAQFSAFPVELVNVAATTSATIGTGTGATNDYNPAHTLNLSAYKIGKYEVTNQQFAEVLNWAKTNGRIFNSNGTTAWTSGNDVYSSNASGKFQLFLFVGTWNTADIDYNTGTGLFYAKNRTGASSVSYNTGNFPVINATWYGAAAFTNWLSEKEGLTPVYAINSAGWPATFSNNGYRLPTEAQWERAAAWDSTTSYHYNFANAADALTPYLATNRFQTTNITFSSTSTNPLGIVSAGRTNGPVGWFNGTNVSPNGSIPTINSPSPVGTYDQSGNALEWVHDWYSASYYRDTVAPTATTTDTPGPSSGTLRVLRGGDSNSGTTSAQTFYRQSNNPGFLPNRYTGFRIAK